MAVPAQSLPKNRIISWLAGPSPPNCKLLIRVFLVWSVVVGLLVWGLTSLGSVISYLLRLPPTLGLPPELSISGCVMILSGTGLSMWLVKYRHPFEMIVSTYYTFVKMFTRAQISKSQGRNEPLVVGGPQKYVRNPLYLGALTIFLGWDLTTGYTASLVGFLLILFWFIFVQIPFEERELLAIFGDQYAGYAAKVPMLIPFTKRNKH